MRTHQANMRVGSEQKEWRIATSGEQRGCRTGSERRRPIEFKYAQPLTISSAIRFLLHPKPESASDSSCSQGLFSLRAKAISAKCVVTKTNDPQVIAELYMLLCIKRLFFRFRPVFFTEAGSVASAESTRQGFSAIKQRSPRNSCQMAPGPWGRLVENISGKLAFFPPRPATYSVLEHLDGTGELYIQPTTP